MTLFFVTGNPNKVKEVQAIIPEVEQIDLDLPEIQSLDPHGIISEKLKEATKEHDGEFFLEDTSMYLECLNGFPGPLIKWLIDAITVPGIAELVQKYKNNKAVVKTVIGYSNGEGIHFFSGELKGIIVSPRGKSNFGFDPIFQPDGHNQTMAEMAAEEKNEISMRKKALQKLKKYLEKNA